MRSADVQALDALEQLLTEQDNTLSVSMSRVFGAIADVAQNNQKLVNKLQTKLVRAATKSLTGSQNKIDSTVTSLMSALSSWQFDVNYLLENLASKCGLKKIGEPLEAALLNEMVKGPELAVGTQIVLSIREIAPSLRDLIEVLREIRDAISGSPSRDKSDEVTETDEFPSYGTVQLKDVPWDDPEDT